MVLSRKHNPASIPSYTCPFIDGCEAASRGSWFSSVLWISPWVPTTGESNQGARTQLGSPGRGLETFSGVTPREVPEHLRHGEELGDRGSNLSSGLGIYGLSYVYLLTASKGLIVATGAKMKAALLGTLIRVLGSSPEVLLPRHQSL
ncbi:pentatricopeptide repeat-containing protein [Dorcoceras hygrometricum]|uniref:Pentatricopeptide repeat-containing protein n=1 Tax=Dorcoceras hygrometricum TaxID=472368 RepID=A0A2Z7CTN9_9LAMI|nr:pentatricopeptide repeat-containing protein [Dorcoceras hygrometricum]